MAPSADKVPSAPLAAAVGVLLADQLSKALVSALVEPETIGFAVGGDLFWLVHARNPGIAFSLGEGLPPALRAPLVVLVPAALLLGILLFYFRNPDLRPRERWALACILGGGLGNLLDRILRPEGVVDFLSVKFFGILGLERWPTFNLADAAIVLASLYLAAAVLFEGRSARPSGTQAGPPPEAEPEPASGAGAEGGPEGHQEGKEP